MDPMDAAGVSGDNTAHELTGLKIIAYNRLFHEVGIKLTKIYDRDDNSYVDKSNLRG